MDVVYPYKRSPGDFELRYSLRSLENVPHDRVIIAGDVPFNTSDAVVTVKNPRVGADRYMSSTANIFAAMQQADISGDFVLMHDDIFVLKPWTFRHEDRGPINAYDEAKGDYLARIKSTAALLRSHGIDEPLFYGLHTPTIYNSSRLVDLIREFPMPRFKYLLRTLYHNLFPQPSVRREDVKLKDWTDAISKPSDVLSISDNIAMLPTFRAWIDARFPRPSVYEVG